MDPHYTPSFWKGSLTSLHSVYEKLVFPAPTTDIIYYSENCKQQTSIQCEDTASLTTEDQVSALIPPSPTVEPTHGGPHTQPQTIDLKTGKSCLQKQFQLSTLATDTTSTAAPDTSIVDTTLVSDILSALETKDTTFETRVGIMDSATENNTSESVLHTESGSVTGTTSLLMNVRLKTCPIYQQGTTGSGYISDSDIYHHHQVQIHPADSENILPFGPDCSVRKDSSSNETDKVISRHRTDHNSSSSYVTEFGSEIEPGACERQKPGNSDVIEQSFQLDSLFSEANGVGSDYTSDSTVSMYISHRPNKDFAIVTDTEMLPISMVEPTCSAQTNSSSSAETQCDNYVASRPSSSNSTGFGTGFAAWESQNSDTDALPSTDVQELHSSSTNSMVNTYIQSI